MLRENKGSLAKFTDLEQWHWHAYDYAFRRVFLGITDARSMIDPDGYWHNSRLVDEAEAWLRRTHRMNFAKVFEPAHPNKIRDDCARIPQNQLTELEHEFLRPGLEAMMRRGRAALDAAAQRWRAVFRAPRKTHYDAPDEPSTLPDVTIKDPALAVQAAERLGIRMPYAEDDGERAAQ